MDPDDVSEKEMAYQPGLGGVVNDLLGRWTPYGEAGARSVSAKIATMGYFFPRGLLCLYQILRTSKGPVTKVTV